MTPAELFSALTWRDVLDFGLLYLCIYGALRLVRGTRAAPVLLAVAAFGVLALLVRALDLVAVASLLTNVVEYIIIILIVVFQRELRRLLVYLGRRLLPAGRRQATRSAVGELMAGLDRLQRARIGAMVVLQGNTDILEVATGRGRPVEAPLSADILVALCIPHPVNITHDGAVVVQDLTITRAGVVCPLTEEAVDPRFGTRHRGAIGLSEEIDALVVVLSEERGEIRLVEAGHISEPLEGAEAERRINHWLEVAETDDDDEPSPSTSQVGTAPIATPSAGGGESAPDGSAGRAAAPGGAENEKTPVEAQSG